MVGPFGPHPRRQAVIVSADEGPPEKVCKVSHRKPPGFERQDAEETSERQIAIAAPAELFPACDSAVLQSSMSV